MSECQSKCACGDICRRVDEHLQHQCPKCNYEQRWTAENVAAAPATPAATPMAAWLIERPGVPGPMWASIQTKPFVQFLWTLDANKAIRYARREDAEATKTLMQDSRNLIATEHIWYDAVAMNSEAPQKLPAAAQPAATPMAASELLKQCKEIIEAFCEKHPIWQDLDGKRQDPWGAHALLEKLRRNDALAAAQPQRESEK